VDVRFQAFARLEDLRREVASAPPAFLIAPDWLVATECIDEQLRPIAQPRRGGATSGRRALMAGPAVRTAAQIAGGSVAAAVPATAGNREDVSIGKFRADHPGIKIIPVPKDIDALLAVGFGQVDAAFVSLAQFEMLERVNPKLTANLREIGYSQESPFPKLYATTRASDDAVAAVVRALGGARERGAGRRMLATLGFDETVALDGAAAQPIAAPTACRFDGGDR
jgi:ABC-type amino acid transport substrate-binding protein